MLKFKICSNFQKGKDKETNRKRKNKNEKNKKKKKNKTKKKQKKENRKNQIETKFLEPSENWKKQTLSESLLGRPAKKFNDGRGAHRARSRRYGSCIGFADKTVCVDLTGRKWRLSVQ